MIRKCCLVLSLFMLGCITGCGSSGPTNVMENADEQAIADYKAAIAEEQAMTAADEEE